MARIDCKLKIVAILCFVFISLSTLIAYTNPSKDFELSIYESTPISVWVLLIISIAGGVAIIVHQVYTKEYKYGNFWQLGFLILILSRVTLLYIPFIRGYYTWNGDNISHIGFVKDILFTGHIPSDNFYPITHILLTMLISSSGAPIELIVNHSTALLSIFYVVSIYLLATTALSSREAQLLSVAAIGGVLFNGYDVYLMPNGWSILYLPLVFFLFFKSLLNRFPLEHKLLLVVTLVLFPFFHPLSSLMLIIMILTIGVISCLIHIIGNKNVFWHNIPYLFPITSTFIVLTILLPWILSFQGFKINIHLLYNALTTGYGQDVIAQMGERLNKINVHGLDFVNLILKIMGDDIIFLVLSIIAAIILFKNHEERKRNNNLLVFIGITFVVGMMYVAYLFNIIPGLGNIGSQRLLAYLVIFTPISAGFTLKHFINKKNYISAIVCIVIIMMASIISILSLFPSPYILQPNVQVTQMDMYGVKWFVDNKDRKISDTVIMSPTYRFADAIIGSNEVNKRTDIKHFSLQIPDHFNYYLNKYIGESYTEDKYAVITEFDKTIYDTVWKVVGRFHKEDFEKLEMDKTVDKLYNNGELNVWYVRAV
ncbi:MAG: hypothetical protein O8C66_08885 [Candidatus Methanoperedens sp.]|nr:hypothetical protein [Candidatus Methanoperedens sp.]MCZ7370611.1 hypothetical protein [Candidatus Methanoperedens sp.]